MATYHVDKTHPSASDSWTKVQNSVTQPWLTIRRGVRGGASVDSSAQAITAGDTLVVHGHNQTYSETRTIGFDGAILNCINSGAASNIITIKAADGENVTITTPSGGNMIGADGVDYIHWEGFHVLVNLAAGGADFACVLHDVIGCEIRYCDIEGNGNSTDGGFLWAGIYLFEGLNNRIFHNEIHGFKGNNGNACGIMQYHATTNATSSAHIIEDNWLHDCYAAWTPKQRALGATFRRNWAQADNFAVHGNSGNTNVKAQWFVYDNVFDKEWNTLVWNENTEVHDNLFRLSGSSRCLWNNNLNKDLNQWKIWNNVVQMSSLTFWEQGGARETDEFNFLDYNFFAGGSPTYKFGATSLTLTQMKALGSPGPYETQSAANLTFSNIYNGSWTLLAPYTTAGRGGGFRSTVGPADGLGNSIVADILDTSRYGPNARAGSNQPPTAVYTFTRTGLAVSVNGTTSTDQDGTIASYDWDWGDNTSHGSGSTSQHTYTSGGNYTLTLTVADDDGATDSVSQSVNASELVRSRVPRARSTVRRGVMTGTRGVELWLPLRDMAGVRLLDKSVNRHIATIRGAAWKPSPAGGCLRFDGVDDDVLIAADPNLVFTSGQAITLSAWIFLDTLTGTTWFLSKDAGSDQYNYSFEVNSTGKLRWEYRNFTSSQTHTFQTTNVVIATGRWYHVAMTYVYGVGTSIKMWVDGCQYSGSWAFGTGNDAPIVGNDSLYLGGRSVFGSVRLDGGMMDVRILRTYASTGMIRRIGRDIGGCVSLVPEEHGRIFALETIEEESSSSSASSASSASSQSSSSSSSSSSESLSESSSFSSSSSSSSSSHSSSSPSSSTSSSSQSLSESSPSSQSSSSSSSSLSSSSSSSASSLSSESSRSSESSSASSQSSSSSQSSVSSSSSSAQSESSMSSSSSSSDREFAPRFRIVLSVARV